MRTRGHACTGTHAHGNMHTQRNTPTSLRGGCCRADGVARLQNHACAHPRCDAMARTAARSPWQARGTRVCKHACNGAGQTRRCAVRGGGSVSSPPCPQVTVCFGMNHTPSLCLGFPTGARGPRQFRRRGTRRRQGPRLPAQPQAGVPEPPQPCASSPCARFCTRVHAQGTHASSSMHVHNRPPMHALHRDSSHPHLSPCTQRHARCLAGANHAHTCATTHVCNHVHPVSPPPARRRVCGPLGGSAPLLRPAAPHCSVSVATLRIYQWRRCGKTLLERREEEGGLAGSWRGTDGRPWGVLGSRGAGGSCARLQSDARAGVCGRGCGVHRRVQGELQSEWGWVVWLFPAHLPPRFSQPLSTASRQAPRAVGGLRALRGQGMRRRGPREGPVVKGTHSLPADGQISLPCGW